MLSEFSSIEGCLFGLKSGLVVLMRVYVFIFASNPIDGRLLDIVRETLIMVSLQENEL